MKHEFAIINRQYMPSTRSVRWKWRFRCCWCLREHQVCPLSFQTVTFQSVCQHTRSHTFPFAVPNTCISFQYHPLSFILQIYRKWFLLF